MARVKRDMPPLDGSGRIDADAACLGCGYNLRGLSIDGACPECGLAVDRSARGEWLRHAEPGWVRTLARGATLVLVGMLAQTLWWLAWLAGGRSWSEEVLYRVALPTAVLTGACVVVGTWMVTRPRSLTARRWASSLTRVLARFGLGIGYLLAVLLLMLDLDVVTRFLPPPWVLAVPWLGVGLLALLLHVRQLALHLPDRRLADEATAVVGGLTVGVAMLALAAVLGGLVLAFLGGWLAAIVSWIFGAGGVLTLMGFSVWALALVASLRNELHEAARQAAASQRTHPPPDSTVHSPRGRPVGTGPEPGAHSL